MSDEFPAAIGAAIIAVKKQIRQIGVDEKNPHGGYAYVSVDRMYQVIGPMMAESGLALLIDEAEADIRESAKGTPWLFTRYALRFMHESGVVSQPLMRSCALPISGPQAFGAAQSYIEKQFLRQIFKVPTGEKDADQVAQTETPPPRRPTSRPAAPVENGRDATSTGNSRTQSATGEDDGRVSANLLIKLFGEAKSLDDLDDLIDRHDGTMQQLSISRRDLYGDIIVCLKEKRRELREAAV